MNPAIKTLSPVWTKPRVLVLASVELAGCRDRKLQPGHCLSRHCCRSGSRYSYRGERRDDGRFQIVGWRDSGRLDFGFLRIFPIIVSHDEGVALVEIERRISQAISQRHAIYRQRRSQPPNDYLFRSVPVIMKPPMSTLSPVPTLRRAERLSASAGGSAVPRERESSRGDLIMPGGGRVKVVPKKILVRIDRFALRAVGDISEAVVLRIRGEPVKESVSIETVKSDGDPLAREGSDGGVEISI